MTGVPPLAGQGITRRFRSAGGAATTVLDAVDLEVNAGELVLVRGASGSGKTTLLHLMATLDVPDEGVVRVEGEDVRSLGGDALALLRRRRLGIVYQEGALIPRLRVWQNVAVALVPEGIPLAERRRRAATALDRVGLAARLDARPAELSGGERQRVAVARALIQAPPILVADEPTSQVDRDTGASILALLAALRDQGSALLIASHDDALDSLADRTLWLQDGRLVAAEASP